MGVPPAWRFFRADPGGGRHLRLDWLRYDETGSYWHNGGTGGFSPYAIFNPEQDFAVMVLANLAPGEGAITDPLRLHVAQRLGGRPAVVLNQAGCVTASFLGVLDFDRLR